MPILNFDGLWNIVLRLLSEKGDRVASQGVLHITVIMSDRACSVSPLRHFGGLWISAFVRALPQTCCPINFVQLLLISSTPPSLMVSRYL